MGLDPLTIGLTIGLLGTGASIHQQSQAASEQREGRRVGRAQQQVEAARQRRAEARQARIRRAQVSQSAVGFGVGGSSGDIVASQAPGMNAAQASGSLFGDEVTATAISKRQQNAADNMLRANIASSVADLGWSMASNPDIFSQG